MHFKNKCSVPFDLHASVPDCTAKMPLFLVPILLLAHVSMAAYTFFPTSYCPEGHLTIQGWDKCYRRTEQRVNWVGRNILFGVNKVSVICRLLGVIVCLLDLKGQVNELKCVPIFLPIFLPFCHLMSKQEPH